MKQFFIILSPQEKLVENGVGDVCVGNFLSQLIQEKPIEVCKSWLLCIQLHNPLNYKRGCQYVNNAARWTKDHNLDDKKW